MRAEALGDRAARTLLRFLEGDAATDPHLADQLAVPLAIRGRVIGVVEVINKRGDGGFTDRDQEVASAFAAQAAVAIENARLYLKLADALVESRRSYRL